MARSERSTPDSSRRRIYRQRAGERWWLALLVMPTLLTAAVVAAAGGGIEADLRDDTTTALRSAGLSGTQVEISGRRVTLLVPTGESERKAAAVADSVRGVAEVTVRHVPRSAAEAKACAGLQARVEQAYRGRGIPFAGSSTNLTTAGRAAVSRVAALVVRCPRASVVAEGHTDSTIVKGSTVSLRRAEVLKQALARAGVKTSRIDVRGFGDTFPVASNETAQGRALNNRGTVAVRVD